MKKPELLAPAGDLMKLKVAIDFGADAVFIGGQKFSLRANAGNFSIDDIREAVEYANKYYRKIYVTMNIYGHENDFSDLDEYLLQLESLGVHGIIAADPVIITRAQNLTPKLEVHLSTQQSVANVNSAKFWQQLGLERLVLARELTKDEIKDIISQVDCEFEIFVHGAMCIAYSGRCTLSNYMTLRDSNRGGCCQSCRWEYDIVDQQLNHLVAEGIDQFAMSPKDLNLLRSIPEMIELGVDSLKIEGRMKSVHYVATVVTVYRKLIDQYMDNPQAFVFDEFLSKELQKSANRETAPAFFEGIPSFKEQMFNNRDEHPTKEFIGIVKDVTDKEIIIEQRNYFKPGDIIEFFSPDDVNKEMIVENIYDLDGNSLDAARHPKQIVKLLKTIEVSKNSLVRKVN